MDQKAPWHDQQTSKPKKTTNENQKIIHINAVSIHDDDYNMNWMQGGNAKQKIKMNEFQQNWMFRRKPKMGKA